MKIKRPSSEVDFDMLFRTYGSKVLSYARHHLGHLQDAEDAASQVFLKIQEKWHTYDPERGAVSTWIYTITRNEVYDILRHRSKEAETEELSFFEQIAAVDFSPEETLLAEEKLSELTTALQKLSQRERDILMLRFYSGMSSKQVALQMGLSDGNVRYIQMKALQKLRILIA